MSRVRAGPLRRFVIAAAATVALAGPSALLRAQTAISSISTYFTAGQSGSVNLDGGAVATKNDALSVSGMTDASGNSYWASGVATAAYVRTDSTHSDPDTGSPNPNQSSAWYMGNAASTTSSAPATIYAGYDSGSPGSMLLGNNLLQGSDNLFNNVAGSTGNNGDIERLDLIYNGTTGLTASNSLAIALFDRGVGDNFKIALITGVDSSGNPTSYGGNLVSVSIGDFGGDLLNSGNTSSTILNAGGEPTDYLLRYDSTTSLAASHNTADDENNNQNISGVVFNLSDFGIATGTKIYGYSIMAGDVTDGGNINNLVNYNNTAYFPTNTTEGSGGQGADGLDPAAVNGVIFLEQPLPEPSAYGALLLGLGLAGLAWRGRKLRTARS